MPPVLLALGSNLGHRINQLHNARQALLTRVTIAAASSIYETDPLYIPDQPTFLNMAIRGSTNLSPQELLEFVKQCESDLGRTDSVRFGPRVIDIDIIDYDGIALNLPDLIIPIQDFKNAHLSCNRCPTLHHIGGTHALHSLRRRC